MTLCIDTLWVNEKCTIEIGGWWNCGYDKEQVGETSSRLNVTAGKLQLKAKMWILFWKISIHFFPIQFSLSHGRLFHGAATFSKTTFNITTLSMEGCIVTCNIKWHSAFIVNVILMMIDTSIIMLSVVMLNAVLLNVVAPFLQLSKASGMVTIKLFRVGIYFGSY